LLPVRVGHGCPEGQFNALTHEALLQDAGRSQTSFFIMPNVLWVLCEIVVPGGTPAHVVGVGLLNDEQRASLARGEAVTL
jgi:hypothetical protein